MVAMLASRDELRADAAQVSGGADWPEPGYRIISWNLLRRVGAGVNDVATLIRRYRPDLLLMQEATEELARLPSAVGGAFFREPMNRRIYGLAVWSPHALAKPRRMALPVSSIPGHFPPRIAQVVRLGGVSIANVHLSHGQFLNRWQLLHIVRLLEGPVAVIGDYNAVGPIPLPGLRDVGPRKPTHLASNIISLRLDRCMVRGLRCRDARVLERGPSDHHPIILELEAALEAADAARPTFLRPGAAEAGRGETGFAHWLRAVTEVPERIRAKDANRAARAKRAKQATRR